MVQTIIYVVLGLAIGFILFTMLIGKLLNSGFKNREDSKVLKKWKEEVKWKH